MHKDDVGDGSHKGQEVATIDEPQRARERERRVSWIVLRGLALRMPPSFDASVEMFGFSWTGKISTSLV